MTHVEIDVLTGETEVLDAQIFFDCGKSLNPAVDVGQVEGCFIQGLGFSLVEKIEHDSAGRLLSNGTWDYRLPTALDVPHNMEVHFLNTSNDARGNVLGSKASGEPAMVIRLAPSSPSSKRSTQRGKTLVTHPGSSWMLPRTLRPLQRHARLELCWDNRSSCGATYFSEKVLLWCWKLDF